MEHPLKILAQHWDLSSDQYWHLRLLSALLLGPLLGVLFLVFFDKRSRTGPRAVAAPKPTMWVNSKGQLLS